MAIVLRDYDTTVFSDRHVPRTLKITLEAGYLWVIDKIWFENLQTIVALVYNHNVSFVVNGYTQRSSKLAHACALSSDLSQELALQREHLYSMITLYFSIVLEVILPIIEYFTPIANKNPLVMHGHTSRTLKQAFGRSVRAPLRQELSVFGEFYDTMIARVANVHIVLRIGRYITEATIAADLASIPAYDSNKIELRVEYFDSYQALITHIHTSLFVYVHAIRIEEVDKA